jgi:hypothetical protein
MRQGEGRGMKNNSCLLAYLFVICVVVLVILTVFVNAFGTAFDSAGW